jgi:hypothetical protein
MGGSGPPIEYGEPAPGVGGKSPPCSEDRPGRRHDGDQKDDHAGLSLDLGVSGPRRSHIAARIAVGGLGGRVKELFPSSEVRVLSVKSGARSPAWTASEPMPAALIPPATVS